MHCIKCIIFHAQGLSLGVGFHLNILRKRRQEMMRKICFTALMCSAVFVLTACGSSPKTNMASNTSASSSMQPAMVPPESQSPVAQAKVQSAALAPHLDPASALYTTRSVYFDYDNFQIKPEYQSVLDLHGKYLARNPKLSIRIEGNADERGSAEYNLALGQKRAEAVLRSLKTYGVDTSQMEAVSWGKEKPKATGHDEAAYAKNRRVDLVYPTK